MQREGAKLSGWGRSLPATLLWIASAPPGSLSNTTVFHLNGTRSREADRPRLSLRHTVYLDNASRTAMKADLAEFYASARPAPEALAARRLAEAPEIVSQSRYRRRFSRTPY